jgi:hypothetical protein
MPDPGIGRELLGFFEKWRRAGSPADWQDKLDEFDLSDEAVEVLRSGDTAAIEQHVRKGQVTPMIFWPPGAS